MTFKSFDDVYDAAPDLDARTRGWSTRSSPRPASTARSCTRCRGARSSPSAPSRCCTSVGASTSSTSCPGCRSPSSRGRALGVDPMDGDARVVDGRAIDTVELAGPDAHRAVRQPARALRREAHAARAPRSRHAGHGAPATRPAPTSTSRRCRSPSSTARVEPDHLTSLFVDAGRRAARRARSVRLLAADQAAARSRRVPVGRRADAPLAHPLPARGVLRGGRGARGAPADGPSPAAYAALDDELGDLLYQVVFHAVLARGGRRVHDGRRRPRDPRQARAPPPARVRRRRRRRDRRRRAQLGADQEGREGHDVDRRGHHRRACRRCSTRTSCSARRRRSGSIPASLDEALDRIDTAVARAARRASADLEADLAQVLAAAVVHRPRRRRRRRVRAPRLGRRATAAASRPWSGSRSTATSTSPPSTQPASPPSGSKPPPPRPPLHRTCVTRGVS